MYFSKKNKNALLTASIDHLYSVNVQYLRHQIFQQEIKNIFLLKAHGAKGYESMRLPGDFVDPKKYIYIKIFQNEIGLKNVP